LIGLTVAKRQGRKTVLTRHHSDAIHKISSPAKRSFYLALENYISRKSDHIIAPIAYVRDFLVEKEGVPDSKVTIIPYGQSNERFDAVTRENVEAVRNEFGMAKNPGSCIRIATFSPQGPTCICSKRLPIWSKMDWMRHSTS
jgi:hypothetical protein